MIYARGHPAMILPVPDAPDLVSLQGARQGDPAAILLLSLVIQSLARDISNKTDVDLIEWYANDSTLAGTFLELCKALTLFTCAVLPPAFTSTPVSRFSSGL